MAKFVPLLIALLMLGIFSFAFLAGGINLQVQNDAPILLNNDSATRYFYQSINDTLYDSSDNFADANQAFSNSSITTTGVVPYLDAIGGVWKIMKTAPLVIYNLVIGLTFAKLFGDQAALVITSVLGGIMIIIIISAVVFMISRGEAG